MRNLKYSPHISTYLCLPFQSKGLFIPEHLATLPKSKIIGSGSPYADDYNTQFCLKG